MKFQIMLGQRTVRLAACAAVAGAAAFVMSAAHAEAVYVDFSGNALSTVPFDITGFYLNAVTGATSTTESAGYDINPYFSGTGGATPVFRFFMPSTGGMVGANGFASVLSTGATVGASSSFINGVVNANQFAVPATNYFGFSFLNESTAATNYGYISVLQTVNPVVAGSVSILGYAYENTGADITVMAGMPEPGQVPEPSTILMLLTGLVGIGAVSLRQRRKGV